MCVLLFCSEYQEELLREYEINKLKEKYLKMKPNQEKIDELKRTIVFESDDIATRVSVTSCYEPDEILATFRRMNRDDAQLEARTNRVKRAIDSNEIQHAIAQCKQN